jgi:hypothetical protein
MTHECKQFNDARNAEENGGSVKPPGYDVAKKRWTLQSAVVDGFETRIDFCPWCGTSLPR